MEKILLLMMVLVAIGIVSDILVKGIEALYVIHLDLLISEPWIRNLSFRRFIIIYCMIFIIGIMLVNKNLSPQLFFINILFSLFLTVIIITDYEQRLIFDRILIGIAFLAVLSFGLSDISLYEKGMGMFAGGAGMFILAVLMRGTLGFGDVKLVAVLGLWQGISQLPFILFTGFIGGGVAAFLFLLLGIKKRRDFFAYGPYFVFGAFINMITG